LKEKIQTFFWGEGHSTLPDFNPRPSGTPATGLLSTVLTAMLARLHASLQCIKGTVQQLFYTVSGKKWDQ